MTRSSRLSIRLALAFVSSTAAMALVCVVALVSLANVSATTRNVVSRQVDLLRDAAAFDALLYQKGFVADYMLTHNPIWLQKLETSRMQFNRWIDEITPGLDAGQQALLAEIVRETVAYDRERQEAVKLFDRGRRTEAVALIERYHIHVTNLLALSQRFGNAGQMATEAALRAAERSISKLSWLLVATSLLSAVSSVIVGFLWARRIARPMLQLQLQIESAAQKTRLHVTPSDGAALDMADQITALVHKVEEADALLAEQRRRVIQSEKMSAMGELTAKLAHEIMNPLAGIKAAVQLMEIEADARELSPSALRQNTEALGREVSRIDQLVRRLMGYARPLSPVVEVCDVRRLIEAAWQGVRAQLRTDLWPFVLNVDPQVPPLELDPLLVTQVFVNVFRNACEAMPGGGAVTVEASVVEARGRREVLVEVRDEGPGLLPSQIGAIFTPFRSTKPNGHGLGLATSRNIVVEHGGTLEAANRSDRAGAIFRIALPLVR